MKARKKQAMEKQILKSHAGKERGYKISVNYNRDGEPCNVYVKKSVRTATGSTSVTISILGKYSDFRDEDEIVRKANEAYARWKREKGTATVVFSEEADCVDDDVRLGSVYISHFLNELGILQKLGALKGETKSKYRFDLSSVARALICSQILDPGSKRHMYLSDSGIPFPDEVALQHVYRSLDVLARHSDEINAYSYKRIRKLMGKDTKLYFYDCTNFYYTQGSEGELLGMKKSKEGIFAPLVQMGLLIDEWGFIVGMLVFKGNRNEQPTLSEQIAAINPHIPMENIVVCTDAGLCSFSNKMYLSKECRAYITTQPIAGTTVPDYVKAWVVNDSGFRDSEGKEEKASDLKRKYEEAVAAGNHAEADRILSRTVYKDAWFMLSVKKRVAEKGKGRRRKWTETDFDPKTDDAKDDENTDYSVTYSKETYTEKETEGKAGIFSRLLVSFSMKYYLLQKRELDEKRRKARELAGSGKRLDAIPKELRGFLDCDHATSEGEVAEEQLVTVDEEAFDEAERYLGYYVQATNLGDSAKDLYLASRMRWQIEYCFRTMKTNLNCFPIYLKTKDHVIGHFTVVCLALQTLRYMMYRLYQEEGHRTEKLGRADGSIVTMDSVIAELRNMTGRKFFAKEGYYFINGSKKTDMSTLMAKAFKLSLTKQVLRIDRLEEYSGLKL